MENLTIESAKQFLQENGYFTTNLWHVDDVKSKYDCTDDQAQQVLNDVLHGEYFVSEINASIDITAEVYNLPKKRSKYFAVSGFWKDDETEFEDYIIKEIDLVDEDEDTEIFFYGLSEEDIKFNNASPRGSLEFVLTGYQEISLPQ